LKFKENYEYIPGVGIVSFSEMLPDKRLHIREKVGQKLSDDIIRLYCQPSISHPPSPSNQEITFYPAICCDSPATVIIRSNIKHKLSESDVKALHEKSVADYASEEKPDEHKLESDELELVDAVRNTDVQKVEELLRDKYVDVNIKSDGKQLIDLALEIYVRTMNTKYLETSLRIVNILKSRGAKQNIFDAALIGDIDRVKECIEVDNIYINIQNNAGKSALHRAVLGNHLDIVQCLLEKGCFVDLTDPTTTALVTAATRGYDQIVATLLKFGANVNVKQGRQNLLQLVTKQFCTRRQSSEIETSAALKIIELLTLNGCNPFYHDTTVETVDILLSERPAVYYAIATENVTLFKLFIEYTNDLERKVLEYRGLVGESLLDEIILRYNGKNDSALLEMYALIKRVSLERLLQIITEYGETAFHYIAATNFYQLFEPIINDQTRTLFNQQDIYGLTPMNYAIGNSSDKVVQYLKNTLSEVDCSTPVQSSEDAPDYDTAMRMNLSLRQITSKLKHY
jgi:ankyrin repeat protein